MFRILRQREDGQSLVEYAMIIALVAFFLVGSLQALVQVPIMNCLNQIVGSL